MLDCVSWTNLKAMQNQMTAMKSVASLSSAENRDATFLSTCTNTNRSEPILNQSQFNLIWISLAKPNPVYWSSSGLYQFEEGQWAHGPTLDGSPCGALDFYELVLCRLWSFDVSHLRKEQKKTGQNLPELQIPKQDFCLLNWIPIRKRFCISLFQIYKNHIISIIK